MRQCVSLSHETKRLLCTYTIFLAQNILKVKPFFSYCLFSLISTSSNRSHSTGFLNVQFLFAKVQGTQHNQEGGRKQQKENERRYLLLDSLLNSLKVCTMIFDISRYSLSVITPAISKSRGMIFSKPLHLTFTLNVRRLSYRRMACEAFGAFFRRGVFSLAVMSTAKRVTARVATEAAEVCGSPGRAGGGESGR